MVALRCHRSLTLLILVLVPLPTCNRPPPPLMLAVVTMVKVPLFPLRQPPLKMALVTLVGAVHIKKTGICVRKIPLGTVVLWTILSDLTRSTLIFIP